jgi:hypothetical protein
MFYGVFYYTQTTGKPSIVLGGFYQTLDEAKERITVLLPDYISHMRNTVKSGNQIGWVNEYEFGDVTTIQTACDQPFFSVNLF